MTKKIEVNPLPFLVRSAWSYAADQRRRFVIYVALSFGAMGFSLCEPLIIGKLMNILQGAPSIAAVFNDVVFFLGLFGSLTLFFWLLHGPSRVMEREVAFSIRTNYQLGLFNKVTALPIQWHKDNHSGETIDKINRAATALNDFIESSFETIHIVARFVGSVAILCVFMPYAGLAILAVTILIVLVTVFFDRILFVQYEALNGFFHKVASAVHDYLTNITTVISLRLEGRAAGEVLRRIRDALPTYHSNIRLNEWKWFINNVLISTTIVGVLIGYCMLSISSTEAFMVGTFFTLFEYLRRVGDGFFGFSWKYGQLVTFAARVKSAQHIVTDYDSLVSSLASASLPQKWEKLDIRDLAFAYEDEHGSKARLDNINLQIKRGEAIALVGESGSGKSTLLSLLRMLRTPQQVKVFCDGIELTHGLAHVAHTTTLIPQDPEIFADTIRFNVCMGVETTDEEILEAMRLSRFDSVLKRLSQGLATNIAEKGVNLSGGEKQRLALARGLFFARASEVILLDESTSSVDTANERVIYETLLKLFKDRAVVAAIHKLHLLPLFDRIYVFSNGKLIEEGSYKELSSRSGELSRLLSNYRVEQDENRTKGPPI